MTPYYNKIIRKLVVAFGNLFNDITLIRYDQNDEEQLRVRVPIAYAPKERYLMRLQGDPDLTKNTQIVLPRMSFEMTGMSYDSARKQNTMGKKFAKSETGNGLIGIYNPVPYNFDFSLSFYVRNIEDGNQILEQILPYFTPDYTVKINLIPEMDIVKEIPIILDGVNQEIEYEGQAENETRIIIWTLSFTMHGYLFGPQSPLGYIQTSIANISDDSSIGSHNLLLQMASGGTGKYKEGEIIYQGFMLESAGARAKVISWNPTTKELLIEKITGNFKANEPVFGVESAAEFDVSSIETESGVDAKITVTPKPANANISNNTGFITTITEFPNIA